MRFYYQNSIGDFGGFKEKDLIKAIYTSWNIEANLYLINEDYKGKITTDNVMSISRLVFAPWQSNEFNSDLLKDFGYKMVDGEGSREIVELKTGKIVKYDWSEVMQLI